MASQVSRIAQELDTLLARTVAKVTLDITANLIATTPIDTGWARANWLPTIAKPAPAQEDPGDEGSRSAATAGLKQQQEAGQLNIAINYKSIKQGPTFVTNNVRYIQKLNTGSSTQAPAGFVQAAIDKASSIDIKVLVR